MNQWISVIEGLPESTQTVLVYIQLVFEEYQVAFYFEDDFYLNSIDGRKITKGVTHWMQLPEPPK